MSENKVSRYDFKIHPCAKIFPELSTDEFAKLKTDIRAHGQVEPVTLTEDGETLLDGRNRVKACQSLGIPVLVKLFHPEPNLTEEDLIWSINVPRRHLTADQRAALSLKWVDTIRATAKERQLASLKRGDQKPVLADSPKREPVHTREAQARKAEVSPNKIRQVDKIHKVKPELLPKVESGEIKLSDALKQATKAIGAPPLKPARTTSELPIESRACGWLHGTLVQFEERNYGEADPTELHGKLRKDDIEILRKCTGWMAQILKADDRVGSE